MLGEKQKISKPIFLQLKPLQPNIQLRGHPNIRPAEAIFSTLRRFKTNADFALRIEDEEKRGLVSFQNVELKVIINLIF